MYHLLLQRVSFVEQSILQVISAIIILSLFVLIPATPTFAAGRVALVYGNGAYTNAPKLLNPANDAALVSKSLKAVGFKVVTLTDGDQIGMRKALSKFGRLAENADIALFYFAGHGLQVAGRNWLLPIDADIESSTDLPASAISANTILELMELSGAKARIAILDACRNNPLSRSLSRATSRGLAKIDSSAAGSMIVFATAPGNVALDGSGVNSPFSKSLASQILVPGLEIRQMIGRVRKDVMADTNDKQVPWVNEAIVGDIYLASAPIKNVPALQQTTVVQNSNTVLEIAFWDSVKSSNDVNMLQLYVNRFPAGVFVEIAKVQIASLNSKATNQVAPTINNQRNSQQEAHLNNNPVVDRNQQMKEAAHRIVMDYQRLSSGTGDRFVSGLRRFYSNSVNFYGKQMSVNQIRADKRRFVKRWPSRNYRLVENSIVIVCYPNSNICTIDGTLDWQVSSSRRNASSSGQSSAFYEVEFFNSGPRIVAEDGKVLQRN